MRAEPKAGQVWEHFKGVFYIIIAVGHHSETGERMVVYRSASGFKDVCCIRPLDMFMSEVDRQKYPNAEQKYRFELVE